MPDWRDAAAYAVLVAADRALFAWEWLRRDPLYREAWTRSKRGSGRSPADFGLAAFEDPALGVPFARPVWLARASAGVLQAEPWENGADPFDFATLARFATLVRCSGIEHLLLSDGRRQIRADGPEGAFTRGAVALRFTIGGLASAAPKVMALRRLIALCTAGRFASSLHPQEARAHRFILMLRAFDAMTLQATQREIARELLQGRNLGPQWRSEAPSLRSRAQRLVRSTREAAAGGYRGLLR